MRNIRMYRWWPAIWARHIQLPCRLSESVFETSLNRFANDLHTSQAGAEQKAKAFVLTVQLQDWRPGQRSLRGAIVIASPQETHVKISAGRL